MKILAFVDVHGNMSVLKKLVERAKKPDIDLVICAGDISVFEQNLDKLVGMFSKVEKPFLIIPGNHEDDEHLEKSCKLFNNCVDIHMGVFKGKGFAIIGYGSGGFSEVDKKFENFVNKIKKKINKDEKVILVTHAPPYNTNVDKINKRHCGNKSIRKFIYEAKLGIVICGHLHENAGKKDKIGKTLIINPGYKGKVITL